MSEPNNIRQSFVCRIVLGGETLATQLARPKQRTGQAVEKREKSGKIGENEGQISGKQAQLATWLWAWA